MKISQYLDAGTLAPAEIVVDVLIRGIQARSQKVSFLFRIF